ncbi:MAG TPA: hypothetical protein PLU10_11840, partial [Chitinophagaceae bacterium]|nr:hypothetical protein [Chitinophagaceae bacterium]
SMQAAIENLASMKVEHKVAIVGDMFELEGEAEKEHRNLGMLLREKKIDRVYLCGKLVASAKSELPEALHFESKALLMEELKNNPISNSTILVKASRGIGLETILDYLG